MYSQVNDVKAADIDKPTVFYCTRRSPVPWNASYDVTDINLTKRRIFVYRPKKKKENIETIACQSVLNKKK